MKNSECNRSEYLFLPKGKEEDAIEVNFFFQREEDAIEANIFFPKKKEKKKKPKLEIQIPPENVFHLILMDIFLFIFMSMFSIF